MNAENEQTQYQATGEQKCETTLAAAEHIHDENNTEDMCMAEDEQHLDEDAKVYALNQPSSLMHAALSTRDLWKQFDELNTEMIVTRRGR